MSKASSAGGGAGVSKWANVCPICKVDVSDCLDARLLRSGKCGHTLCSKCYHVLYPSLKRTAAMGETSEEVSLSIMVCCPNCNTRVCPSDWKPLLNENLSFEREIDIRKRVNAILNCDRLACENTPIYREFLEKKEQIIYDLAFGETEEIRAAASDYLKSYETENQRVVLECGQRKHESDIAELKRIVEVEGLFYESVKLGVKPGFARPDLSHLLHPLARENPGLFQTALQETLEADKTTATNASGGGNENLSGGRFLNELFARSLPTTLERGLETLRRRDGVKVSKQLWDAGGHSLALVAEKSKQETFGQLFINISAAAAV